MSDFNKQIACIFIFSFLLFQGCTEINNEPAFSIIPAISIKDISTDSVIQAQDSVVITITYQDGDGDLGESDPDKPTVFVQDQRLNEPDGLHLAPLTPTGEELSIKGDLKVVLPDLFILGNGQQQTTKMRIWFVDRSGNKSNEVVTPTLTIMKQ
ncbi:MAG: hypothetical protein ABI002_08035 [Saprospiraceae bacterium]